MIIVNGYNIHTFDILDTENGIKNRIASALNTISRYLYFPIPIDLNNLQDMEVINILDIIKKHAAESDDFGSLMVELNDKLNNFIDIKRDILRVWLIFNTYLEQSIEDMGGMFTPDMIYETINANKYIKLDEFKKIWIKRDRIRKAFIQKIETFKKQIEIETDMFVKFMEREECKRSEIQVQSAQILIKFDTRLDIMEIFNGIVLNDRIPFVYANPYYKVLKDFTLNENWLKTEGNVELRVYPMKDINNPDNTNYLPVIIDNIDGDITAKVSLKFIPENLTQDEFAKEILKVFNLDVGYSFEQISIRGNFLVYDSHFNYHVLADMAMNDPLISNFIYFDERVKATKSRIFCYFMMSFVDRISVEITNHMSDKEEFFSKIKVDGKDIATLEKFSNIFVKICGYYIDKSMEIIELYQTLLNNDEFGLINITEEEDKAFLFRDIDPNVFIKGYVRMCAKQQRPEVINEDQAKQLMDKSKQVIKFPRDKPDTDKVLPSDSVNQKYYTCANNKEYPYIGLKRSKLDNADDYPFLPCCYMNDQQNSSEMKEYYNLSKQKIILETKQQGLIQTNKILAKDSFGVLPPELHKLFLMINNNINEYEYIRMGVERNTRTFISALISATQNTTYTVEDIILQITHTNDIYLARQCNYDLDAKGIIENINNDDKYFDPRLYIQLIENIFDCHIILFNRKSIFMPRYNHAYYRHINNGNYVFIYENWGTESDNAKYPSCEIIVKHKIGFSGIQTQFSESNVIYKKINLIYTKLSQSYSLNKRIVNTVIPKGKGVNILNQFIDSYGKTRQLTIKWKDSQITLFTSPFAPLAVPEDGKITNHLINNEDIQEFAKDTSILIKSQVVIDNVLKEIIGTWGTLQVSIPVMGGPRVLGLQIQKTSLNYYDKTQSIMKIFNQNEKIARYIIEYMFWMFSIFLFNNQIQKIDDSVLNNFFQTKFKKIKNYNYSGVPKVFTESNSSKIINEGKIVVTSTEMEKRLMYVLKLQTIRNMEQIQKYKERKIIKEYYNDISDFDDHPKQIILNGKDSVLNWIQETKNIYTLYNEILFGTNTPYFFQNQHISKQIMIAQNTENIYEALDVINTWNKDKYNKSIYVERGDVNVPHNLYAYEGMDNIKLHKINGGDSNTLVVGYKIEGLTRYTALLQL